jgi:hypothetical protein
VQRKEKICLPLPGPCSLRKSSVEELFAKVQCVAGIVAAESTPGITLLFVVPLAIVLHFGIILPEERYLKTKFGEQYRALKREVRRVRRQLSPASRHRQEIAPQ